MAITNEIRNQLIQALQEGKEIPNSFKEVLFPAENKEYLLSYSGKMRKEDILNNVDGVSGCPLQVEKVFNGSEHPAFDDGWKNLLVFGDNLQFLKTIYENKDDVVANKVKGKVKLIYIDPPFATEKDFNGVKGQKAYSDKVNDVEFVDFLRKRLIVAKEILAKDGTICIHLDNRKSHYIKVICDEIFQGYDFRQIAWVCGLMGSGSYFPKAHEVILCYKAPGATFNTQSRLGYSKSIVKALKKDEDGWYYSRGRESSGGMNCLKTYICKDSSKTKEEAVLWASENKKQAVWDVWMGNKDVADIFNDFSVGTYNKDKNSVDYPTQKPDELLKRFILSFTNPNEIVLDFFGGSGTTAAVAEKLGRRWVTCDIGKLSYYTIQKRLLTIQESTSLTIDNGKYEKKCRSFITAQLGIYDLQKTFDLDWKSYQTFVSQLFEFELDKKSIGGIAFDGQKDGSLVKIFDFNKLKNSIVNEEYLESMHASIGNKTNGSVYIVSPINHIDFCSDYHEIGDVRYYFLKVPYHVIKELHKKPFERSKQPKSKSSINDLEYAVGFHFITPPTVSSSWHISNKDLVIKVAKFESKGIVNNEAFSTLSSIFICKNFNEEFILSQALFHEDIVKPKMDTLEIKFPLSDLGDKLKLIYTDIYGNEFSEIINLKELINE